MYLKALIGVVISATTIVAAFAQDKPTNQAPKPSLADVQHLAETISSDESRLRAYCDLGKLHDDTQQGSRRRTPGQSMNSSPRLMPSNNNSVPNMTKS